MGQRIVLLFLECIMVQFGGVSGAVKHLQVSCLQQKSAESAQSLSVLHLQLGLHSPSCLTTEAGAAATYTQANFPLVVS